MRIASYLGCLLGMLSACTLISCTQPATCTPWAGRHALRSLSCLGLCGVSVFGALCLWSAALVVCWIFLSPASGLSLMLVSAASFFLARAILRCGQSTAETDVPQEGSGHGKSHFAGKFGSRSPAGGRSPASLRSDSTGGLRSSASLSQLRDGPSGADSIMPPRPRRAGSSSTPSAVAGADGAGLESPNQARGPTAGAVSSTRRSVLDTAAAYEVSSAASSVRALV